LLDGKDCPVNELFSRCGFASKSVFYVAFRKVVGMTPLQYISQSRNPFMIQRN
jgi:AraC-like DNA-binding protein